MTSDSSSTITFTYGQDECPACQHDDLEWLWETIRCMRCGWGVPRDRVVD